MKNYGGWTNGHKNLKLLQQQQQQQQNWLLHHLEKTVLKYLYLDDKL